MMPAIMTDTASAITATRSAHAAAMRAMGAQVLTALVAAVCLALALHDLSYLRTIADGVPSVERAHEMNERAGWVANAGWVVFFVASVALTRWYRASARAAVLAGARVRRSRAPMFIRPYRLLRDLDDAIDPDSVKDVPPVPETGSHAGSYRVPATKPVTIRHVPPAPLMVWWLLWLACVAVVLMRFAMTLSWTEAKETDALVGVGNLVVGVLGILIVQRINRRLAERTRRVCG
jgi:hypothetical protein